jgi:DNA transformation protein
MGELCDLPNIVKKLETQLNKIGIENLKQLKRVVSKQGFERGSKSGSI